MVSFAILFLSSSLSPQEDSTTWCHNFGSDIIVSYFWCDFKVAMVWVNAVGILVIMDIFRRQILFIKICQFGGCSQFVFNLLVKCKSSGFVYFTVSFIVVKVSKRRSTDILSVGLKNLCSEH